MSARFAILLHAAFWPALRRLPAARQARFRRLAERLAAGQWGGGTRVKKLRGFPKPVFEARQDAGDRVLFTLARSAAPDSGPGLATCVQIWDLVEHDDVNAAAGRINGSAEAEFLDYDELESEATGEAPPHAGVGFDEVPPPAAGGEAGVLELMLPPDDFRPREREDIAGGVRWYVVPERALVADGEWQALLDAPTDELELKLTAEQYAVVRAPGPVLLSGSAGSGKTTIAAHRLAAATCGPGAGRALYVTYSGWLRDHARDLYEALLVSRGAGAGAAPDFLTVEELYRVLAARGGEAPGRLVEYPEFARWYTNLFRRGDAALAWEEIRSIVKGACLDSCRPLLGRDEYEALGRKRAPLFVSERPRLYEVARRWQERLREASAVDEIDLCRRALARLGAGDGWDHVICDEAQDLAEIQVELVLRLHRGGRLEGVFLAGDPQQVINPSGFRWAEVRTAIRERVRAHGRPAPALTTLTRNFRSVRGIVELANEVIALKRERTGRSDADETEEGVVAGATPIRVDGAETDLLAVVAGFGPRCAVLAGSEEVRERLRASLDTTRVFTVPEAKGLEFDVVVLWGLVAAEPEPWTRLLDAALEVREDPACRRALHHLYVAVTRARRHLAVFEPPEGPPLWTAARFTARLDPEPPASLARLFVRAASPGDWMREAEYFLERGRPRQAAECFRRAGETRRETECLALHHERAGDAALAARLWADLGDDARAARCFEEAGLWADAARCWRASGEPDTARRCDARAAEAGRQWVLAATAWEALAAWDDAARCWANAGLRTRQVQCLAEAAEIGERWPDAARRWEEADDLDRAANAWERAARPAEAWRVRASVHERARRWKDAAAAWREAGDEQRARRCSAAWAEAEGRWLEAAPLWEQLGDPSAAARAWRRGGRPGEAALCEVRVDLAEGRYVRAAEALVALDDLAGAASAWQRAHEAGQQPTRPLPLVLPDAARRKWAKGGKPARLAAPPRWRREVMVHDARVRWLTCAVTAAERAGRLEEAATLWAELGDAGQALRCRVASLEAAGDLKGAATLLEARGLLEAALAVWQRTGDARAAARGEARLLDKRKRWDEAAVRWTALGEPVAAALSRARALFGRGAFEAAARAFEEAGQPSVAEHVREMAKRPASAPAARPAPAGDPASSAPPGGPAVHRGHDPLEAVIVAVARNPGLGVTAVIAMTGLPRERVQPLLRHAVKLGRLVKTGATRGTRYWPPDLLRPG